MPPAVVAGGFAAVGATAITTSVVSAVYVGAAVGAIVGAATSAITGGDILEGALKGAIIGGVTGGVGEALSAPAQVGVNVAKVGVDGVTGAEAGHMANAGIEAVSAGGTTGGVGGGVGGGSGGSGGGSGGVGGGSGTTGGTGNGFLSGAANWINNNPMPATLLAQTVGGAATSMADARSTEKQLEADMERDRLLIDSKKVSGLSNMDIKIALPTIGAFAEKPKWTAPSGGLLAT